MNSFRSPKSTVVEMSQNQHQVSIIGCSSSSSQERPVVARSFSSASNQWRERVSPEGRSCGDLEQEQAEQTEDQLEKNHCVSVHNVVVGVEGEDLNSFSSCYKYQTPTSNLSQQGSEYFSPKELFADIGIKYIDCEETDGNNGRDDDTSISSFTSTYQTPSSGGSYENKLARDLSREMKETADLSQELSKHAELASLNTSDVSSNISDLLKCPQTDRIVSRLQSQLSDSSTQQLQCGMSSSEGQIRQIRQITTRQRAFIPSLFCQF